MIDSIYIAVTGLRGFQSGLRVIANNTANLNTPGFRGSNLLFGNMFQAAGGGGSTQYGYGLATLGTMLDFTQGQLQSTGNGLDVAVDGQGLFMLRDEAGVVRFTRDGQFAFNTDGFLVSVATGEQVLAFDASGTLTPISVANLRTHAAGATRNVVFSGNLSSTATTHTVGSVTVFDAAGSKHTLSVRFTPVAGNPGTWDVTVMEGTTAVGTGQLAFVNGRPDPAAATLVFDYTVPGLASTPVTLDFSTNVTSFDSGSQSTLTMSSQDGYQPGALVNASFDASGVLQLSYSNGRNVEGPRLALARFTSLEAVTSVGDNQFDISDARALITGVASEQGFGVVRSGMVETSNVDLSKEFSELVIMQRGYQASSQVVSTANDMLNELFGMRGR